MNILFTASEVAPFIKTGGLADVAGSLPQALAAQGHDVRVVLPLYEGIAPKWREQMTFLTQYEVFLSWRKIYCGVFTLFKDGVTYYFIDNEYYFKRTQLYGHFDDGERFAYFSRAVTELPAYLDWAPAVLHCNDWQTALIPIYLLEARSRIPQLAGARSVFTIHNIEYQGRYSYDCLGDLFGLDHGYFESYLGHNGDVNLMKGAIVAADFTTTVSPTYAEELHYAFFAHSMEGVISHYGYKIKGILNGLDVALYDPANDPALPVKYSAQDLAGKAACKEALQKMVGLNVDPTVPIIGCVSRLASHKGFDLVMAAIHDIMALDVQVVILGTGEAKFENAFRQAAEQYPGRFSAQIAYSAALSTAIYSGADLYLMPSISEPCGLSQIIAMRYGTLPVVRETGGLRDTVIPVGQPGERGFTFANINAHDMTHVIWEAVELYKQNPGHWTALQKTAMTTDFSWDVSASAYLDIYRTVTNI